MPWFKKDPDFKLPYDDKSTDTAILYELLNAHYGQKQSKVHKDLVVDDNDVNRYIMSRYLTSLNIEHDIVNDGYAAIKSALQKEYDIIWMDIKMPVCNGLSAAYFLRNKCGYKGLIYGTTGFADIYTKDMAMSAGMSGLVTKPFDIYSIKTIHEDCKI